VRDAWRQVAQDPSVNPAPAQVAGMGTARRQTGFDSYESGGEAAVASHWNA